MFNRIHEWNYFTKIVRTHVLEYTIPQYGDSPTDEVEGWTPEMCILAVQKYTRRFESSKRGPDETLRDMLKIAHFACIAYFKLCRSLGKVPTAREYTGNDNPFVHGGSKDDTKQSN